MHTSVPTLPVHPSLSLMPYLARRLHAFPQGEVHEDEDGEEAEGERSFDRAEIAEAATLIHLQHLHPAAATSRDNRRSVWGGEGQLFIFNLYREKTIGGVLC